MLTATITARAAVDGLHHWPDAHPQRAYLRAPHRHRFIATATVPVDHDERAVEFHDLQDALKIALLHVSDPVDGVGVMTQRILLRDFGPQSCESIARRILHHLEVLGLNPTRVTVSEDGESTATIERS